MTQQQKRRVYIGLAAVILVLFITGMTVGYVGRHSTICKDGKPPREQEDTGIGQVEYLCQNGDLVTK